MCFHVIKASKQINTQFFVRSINSYDFIMDMYVFANCVPLSEKTHMTFSTKSQLKTSYTVEVHCLPHVTLPNGKGFGESS